MGFPKVSAELAAGLPLGRVGLLEFKKLNIDPLVVVTRPGDTLEWLPGSGVTRVVRDGYEVVTCEYTHEGLSRSIQCGLRELEKYSHENEIEAVLITLADNPFINSKLLTAWIDAFHEDPSLDYVATDWNGSLMPPVIWSRSVFEELYKLEGDTGGRELFRSDKFRCLRIPVGEDVVADVDTPEDLMRVRERWRHLQHSIERQK